MCDMQIRDVQTRTQTFWHPRPQILCLRPQESVDKRPCPQVCEWGEGHGC